MLITWSQLLPLSANAATTTESALESTTVGVLEDATQARYNESEDWNATTEWFPDVAWTVEPLPDGLALIMQSDGPPLHEGTHE